MVRETGYVKRAPRTGANQTATLTDSEGAEQTVMVIDISNAGFKLQVTQSPRIGGFVTLRIDGEAEVYAQIRWAIGDQAGGVFVRPDDRSHS